MTPTTESFLLYYPYIIFLFFLIGSEDNVCETGRNDMISDKEHFVPHPFDITKFYLCQHLGSSNRNIFGWSWYPHLMQCPQKTCFSMISKKCVWKTLDNNDSECSIIKSVF